MANQPTVHDGGLAGGGSVAVAVGVNFVLFWSVSVSVLISAHIERFSVSRIQDFDFEIQ